MTEITGSVMSYDVSRKRDGPEKPICFNGNTGVRAAETTAVIHVSEGSAGFLWLDESFRAYFADYWSAEGSLCSSKAGTVARAARQAASTQLGSSGFETACAPHFKRSLKTRSNGFTLTNTHFYESRWGALELENFLSVLWRSGP